MTNASDAQLAETVLNPYLSPPLHRGSDIRRRWLCKRASNTTDDPSPYSALPWPLIDHDSSQDDPVAPRANGDGIDELLLL